VYYQDLLKKKFILLSNVSITTKKEFLQYTTPQNINFVIAKNINVHKIPRLCGHTKKFILNPNVIFSPKFFFLYLLRFIKINNIRHTHKKKGIKRFAKILVEKQIKAQNP
jgi:hypothetical protein